MNNVFKLCYIDKPWAYFTSMDDIGKQWGDDWNDAPYEHNAGSPYEYGNHDKAKGREPWEVKKIAFDGDFNAPCDFCYNSPYSVEQINAGVVAWLSTSAYAQKPVKVIHAGATLSDFISFIQENGGTVYLP